VLVVEDDESIADIMVHLLEDEGYVAMRARNGKEALDVLAKCRHLPGLIVLDLMMPVMNGWEFRSAQLADERLSSIPVIVLSAHETSKERQLGDELGSVRLQLQKPIDIEALLGAIATNYSTSARISTFPPRGDR
jgi:CheY-like chemotaxis protein